MINHRWNSYPYSSNDGKLEIQRQAAEIQREAAERQRQQAERQRTRVAQQHLELAINWAVAEQQLVLNEMRHAAQEFDRIHLELRPSNR